jgi:hypothetical protein
VEVLRYTPTIGRWQAVAVVVIAGIALSLVVWAVSALVIDKWISREQRPRLLERLKPYNGGSVADEAQRWLQKQREN